MKKIIYIIILLNYFYLPLAKSELTLVHNCSSVIKWDDEKYAQGIAAIRNWTFGYLAALDQTLGIGSLKNSNLDAVYYYVVNFCKNNPLKSTDEAVIDLFSKNK